MYVLSSNNAHMHIYVLTCASPFQTTHTHNTHTTRTHICVNVCVCVSLCARVFKGQFINSISISFFNHLKKPNEKCPTFKVNQLEGRLMLLAWVGVGCFWLLWGWSCRKKSLHFSQLIRS